MFRALSSKSRYTTEKADKVLAICGIDEVESSSSHGKGD